MMSTSEQTNDLSGRGSLAAESKAEPCHTELFGEVFFGVSDELAFVDVRPNGEFEVLSVPQQ